MYEHSRQNIISADRFIKRVVRNAFLALGFIVFSLIMGAVGYHYTENMAWIDATLNASMILSGMGPVNELHTAAGKIFATFYSLYSGIAFLTTAAILFVPFIHRFLHRFHLAEDEK